MKIFTMPGICNICGGEGMARPMDGALAWLGEIEAAHIDPAVCRDFLQEKAEKLKRQEEHLKQGAITCIN